MNGTEYLMHAAANLPNLLSMLSMFRTERAHRNDLSSREFQEWLSRHSHEELKEIIFRNAELSREIDRALQEDHKVMAGQLGLIEETVTKIASRLEGLAGIARAVSPTIELTEQASMMLCAASRSSVYPQIVLFAIDGRPPVPAIGTKGWQAPEPEFVLDDLNALLNCGFLEKDGINSSGYPMLRVTRLGKKYAKILCDQNPNNEPVESLDESEVQQQVLNMKLADPRRRDDMELMRDAFLVALTEVGVPSYTQKGVSFRFVVRCPPLSKEMIQRLRKIADEYGFRGQD